MLLFWLRWQLLARPGLARPLSEEGRGSAPHPPPIEILRVSLDQRRPVPLPGGDVSRPDLAAKACGVVLGFKAPVEANVVLVVGIPPVPIVVGVRRSLVSVPLPPAAPQKGPHQAPRRGGCLGLIGPRLAPALVPPSPPPGPAGVLLPPVSAPQKDRSRPGGKRGSRRRRRRPGGSVLALEGIPVLGFFRPKDRRRGRRVEEVHQPDGILASSVVVVAAAAAPPRAVKDLHRDEGWFRGKDRISPKEKNVVPGGWLWCPPKVPGIVWKPGVWMLSLVSWEIDLSKIE